LKQKREYNASAKRKCEKLGWRTDLMCTYIIASANPYKQEAGHVKEEQGLVYTPITRRKAHTPVGIA